MADSIAPWEAVHRDMGGTKARSRCVQTHLRRMGVPRPTAYRQEKYLGWLRRQRDRLAALLSALAEERAAAPRLSWEWEGPGAVCLGRGPRGEPRRGALAADGHASRSFGETAPAERDIVSAQRPGRVVPPRAQEKPRARPPHAQVAGERVERARFGGSKHRSVSARGARRKLPTQEVPLLRQTSGLLVLFHHAPRAEPIGPPARPIVVYISGCRWIADPSRVLTQAPRAPHQLAGCPVPGRRSSPSPSTRVATPVGRRKRRGRDPFGAGWSGPMVTRAVPARGAAYAPTREVVVERPELFHTSFGVTRRIAERSGWSPKPSHVRPSGSQAGKFFRKCLDNAADVLYAMAPLDLPGPLRSNAGSCLSERVSLHAAGVAYLGYELAGGLDKVTPRESGAGSPRGYERRGVPSPPPS